MRTPPCASSAGQAGVRLGETGAARRTSVESSVDVGGKLGGRRWQARWTSVASSVDRSVDGSGDSSVDGSVDSSVDRYGSRAANRRIIDSGAVHWLFTDIAVGDSGALIDATTPMNGAIFSLA